MKADSYNFSAYQYLKIEIWTKVAPFAQITNIQAATNMKHAVNDSWFPKFQCISISQNWGLDQSGPFSQIRSQILALCVQALYVDTYYSWNWFVHFQYKICR